MYAVIIAALGGQHRVYKDLIKDAEQAEENLKQKVGTGMCVACRSTKVVVVDGIFVRGGLYIQTMTCVVCKTVWTITYDSDLNRIEIKIGVEDDDY